MKIIKMLFQSIKKKLVPLLLCTLITGVCLFVLFQHYTSGQKTDLISRLENTLLDLRFINRGELPPKSKIGILAIDEKSIEQFGRWPFSRKNYGPALKNLKKLGVQLIGFDAVFSEEEKSSFEDVKMYLDSSPSQSPEQIKLNQEKLIELEKKSPGDIALAQGVKDFENLVLGYFYFMSQREVELGGRKDIAFQGLDGMLASEISAVLLPEGKTLADYEFLKVHGIVANTAQFNEIGSHFAFFSNEADPDALIRWVTLVRVIDGHLMPSVALKMAALATNSEILVEFGEHGIETIDLVSKEDESKSIKIPVDPLGVGRVLVNHRGPAMSYPHLSLADAYNDSFTEEQKTWLKDSYLFLGMTAIGINDQRPNPFDPTLDGVEIHANIMDNVLAQDLFKRPKNIYVTELIIILLIGLIFSPIMIYSKAAYSGIFALFFVVAYYYFDKFYWFDKGVWAYLGMPFIEVSLLFISTTLYKYMTEEREKKKVRGAFSYYLSPEVINEVLEDPESLQLGGVRKELTVFFSDVRGFTTISESLTPEQLSHFMNSYFTPMTQIILKSKGVLDKYIGDAIMAFWGAPINVSDHADRAVESAIEMLFSLEKLQKEFVENGLPYFDIGIGLNTGPMSVGNMGSTERFCYTVMGDAVNLGSRVEGLTKEYGVRLIATESTVAGFTRPHMFRDLDDIRVKGKNKPIKVFHVFKPDILPEPALKDLIRTFEEGRIFYRAQDWKNASVKFRECLGIYSEDGPSLMYLKRIEEYASEPPIENWDGVYTFTHK